MKRVMLWMLALLVCSGSALIAQNIVGTWQGTLQLPAGPQGKGPALRTVIKITRADDESLKAVFYSIDQNPTPLNASAITQQGSTVKITIAAIGGSYEGKLSADGNTINGSFTQGPQPIPLDLIRTTVQTAWVIPEAPPPPKPMDPNSNPSFDVATIKPSDPNRPGQSILVGRGGGNLFTTTNTTVADLLVFAYGIHQRQVVGGPSWFESEKYDLSAKPDQAGIPNAAQLRTMLQKLLAERFGLTFHREKRELSAYVLTVAKGGPKMAKNDTGGILPGFGGRGPGAIGVRNSTMEEFAGFIQARLVDRPVVDQTGLKDRFDFQLKWIPDSAMLAQLPPGVTLPPPDADAAPDLFAALTQQIGLKMDSSKAPVEVLVIDKVTKASEN